MTRDAAERESFTEEERRAMAPFFTNLDKPVFGLVNLPEVTKGALFARYSRSPKSLRRLFLDEFLDRNEAASGGPGAGVGRAEKLYERVLSEYGDDSVAQLGAAHIAVEGASNILTKVLEHGRLMAYLEQSTRYVPYTEKRGGRWLYEVPPEIEESEARRLYVETLDRAFETYASWLDPMQEYFRGRIPRKGDESAGAYRRSIRAKALDALRGLLPAATTSNVGVFGTGQAYEALLLRMRAHPLLEVRRCADMMLGELQQMIPAFVKRVEAPDRGVVWSEYLSETREAAASVARDLLAGEAPEPRPEVVLTDFDPEGETRVVAGALYQVTNLPDDRLLELARRMSPEEGARVLRAYVGSRGNRRHRPGRAFERTAYRFDVLCDYGAFRDLQRHRMLTIEWQRLTPEHGYVTPDEITDAGAGSDWRDVMERSEALYDRLCSDGWDGVAPYAVAMAYRIRFFMHMNAREAMHVLELRTSPQGHPAYRRVCQTMHRLIAEEAGHRAIAGAMTYVDHSAGEGGRMAAEKATEKKLGRAAN